jgi:hypothetical protein
MATPRNEALDDVCFLPQAVGPHPQFGFDSRGIASALRADRNDHHAIAVVIEIRCAGPMDAIGMAIFADAAFRFFV